MTKKMYVVFKTHFDIGFTDLAENVMKRYREEFIPRAVVLAEEVPEDFVWTTGSWLIHHYLNHEEVTLEAKSALEVQLHSGNIRWHALPATIHVEAGDKTLLEYGISISKDLDFKYNKHTTASKMTDIPGHTIGLVPILAEAGIKYMHIGVNAASSIPEVPEMFIWRAKTGEEVVIHYAKDYGATYQREGWNEMITFAHTHDNQGPPQSAEEINEHMSQLRDEYQDVEIIASGLDEFADYAWDNRHDLPVVEEEIADSWIHGIASDSFKVAQLKTLTRLRDQWLKAGKLVLDSRIYRDFSEQLLLVVEHTWGTNANVHLPDYENYLIKPFNEARKKDKIVVELDREKMSFGDYMAQISTEPTDPELMKRRSYKIHESSWAEQRQYIQNALNILPEDLKKEALEKLRNERPNITEELLKENHQVGVPTVFGGFDFTVATDGGLSSLKLEGKEFIAEGKRYGALSFERFDFGDFQSFMNQYSRLTQQTAKWGLVDFNKRGIEAFKEIYYEHIKPYVVSASQEVIDEKLHVKCLMQFRNFDCENWGLPAQNMVTYVFDSTDNTVSTTIEWQGKQASRMPEAYWVECSIHVSNPSRWRMNKLGSPIIPTDVVKKGNRNLHALDDVGLTYDAADARVSHSSLHAPLHSIGRKSLLKFDQKSLGVDSGVYVLLQNNVWGTNFRDWFDDDMRFDFKLKLEVIK